MKTAELAKRLSRANTLMWQELDWKLAGFEASKAENVYKFSYAWTR